MPSESRPSESKRRRSSSSKGGLRSVLVGIVAMLVVGLVMLFLLNRLTSVTVGGDQDDLPPIEIDIGGSGRGGGAFDDDGGLRGFR